MMIYKLSIFWESCKWIRSFKLCCFILLEEEEYQNHFAKIVALEEKWTYKLVNWAFTCKQKIEGKLGGQHSTSLINAY